MPTCPSNACRSRVPRLSVKAESEHARSIPLKGNDGNQAFWLLDPLQDRYFNVHGTDFIIQRPETFAKIFPKLRLRKLHQRNLQIQVVPSQQHQCTALIKADAPAHAVPVVFVGQEPVVDMTQLLQEVQVDQLALGMVPCSQPGLIHVPEPMDQEESTQEVYVGSTSSPRRTKMIGFTCLRCNARSYKPINPLAFTGGTLVVQCGKCERWHKIKDNLHLFHDFTGELFFRPSPITEADVPEALRMPVEPFYWQIQDDQVDDGSQN